MGKVNCSKSIAFRAMSSMSDDNTLMSIPAMLDAVQDISGIHAYDIGLGGPDRDEKGILWTG